MDIGVISVRYARALLKSASEAKLEAKVYAEMQTLAESYLRVPELRFTIDNPMLAKDKKEDLLLTACGATAGKGKDSGVSELTSRFVHLVIEEGRENALQFMANSYITLAVDLSLPLPCRLLLSRRCARWWKARLKALWSSRLR